MDPKLILNNIHKDLYHVRYPLALYLAILLIRFFFVSNPLAAFSLPFAFVGFDSDTGVFLAVSTYISLLTMSAVLITTWIQADGLNDENAFWKTRPARENHLLIAKLATIAIAFVIPPTLLDLVTAVMRGVGVEALWSIPNGIWTYGINSAPILLAASITSNLGKMVFVTILGLAATAISIAITWSISNEFGLTSNSKLDLTIIHWETLVSLLLGLGFCAAYITQSLYRNRKRALKIAAATIVLAPVISIPRISSEPKLPELENVSLIPDQYILSGSYHIFRNDLRIDRFFRIDDQNPNRILLPLKTNSELTSDLGGRSERTKKWENPSWSPQPFLAILQRSGYTFKTNPESIDSQNILSPLLALNQNQELKAFREDASLAINCAFSEYELVSVREISLNKKSKINENRILSLIGHTYHSSKPIENGQYAGSIKHTTQFKIVESRFSNRFFVAKSDTSEAMRRDNIVRLYFLYDPLNKQISIGSPQFDNRRKFHVDAGSPFFGPSWQRRHKNLSYSFILDSQITIDRKLLKVIAVDVKKTGNRMLHQTFELNDLASQIKAIKTTEPRNER